MNRRRFLATILTTGCAPAIVHAESLMRVITHTAWIGYARGDLLVTDRGYFSEEFDPGATLITQAEAENWLRNAAVRVVPEPEPWSYGKHYTRPEIFHDGKWKSLCRTDLCDDVATGWVKNQSAEKWRQHYLRKINYGLRITDDRFSTIDACTDG